MGTRRSMQGVAIMMLMGFAGLACSRPTQKAHELPSPKVDEAPAAEQAAEAPAGELRTAVFAGGCFWCVEAVFEQLEGVTQVVSGYAGGTQATAQYDLVSAGSTDHAEAVQITYDPAKISYGQLLRVFFATHDPTQLNRQGPDSGRQYRSAVFYTNAEQKRIAEAYIQQLEAAGTYDQPIVTTLESLDASGFYLAEKYHQDFVVQHPNHPYVQMWAVPKVEKVRSKFEDQVKPAG